jgi:hypothetical protein
VAYHLPFLPGAIAAINEKPPFAQKTHNTVDQFVTRFFNPPYFNDYF